MQLAAPLWLERKSLRGFCVPAIPRLPRDVDEIDPPLRHKVLELFKMGETLISPSKGRSEENEGEGGDLLPTLFESLRGLGGGGGSNRSSPVLDRSPSGGGVFSDEVVEEEALMFLAFCDDDQAIISSTSYIPRRIVVRPHQPILA